MRHLLSIDDLSATQALNLIQRAIELKHLSPTAYPRLSDYTAAALFYENSTRTLMSFNLAAQHCGLPLLPLNMQYSSEKKGETFLDTLMTLHAMNIKLFIIRHPSSELFTSLKQLPDTLQLINAGDGTHEHPSQALLDMMIFMNIFLNLKHYALLFLADVRHSRVANSFQKLCALLGFII